MPGSKEPHRDFACQDLACKVVNTTRGICSLERGDTQAKGSCRQGSSKPVMRQRTRSSPPQPLAYALNDAGAATGLGAFTIKQTIAAGGLPFVQVGKRVLVLD